MPVDYSKWDAIELSDDSDIEVHPNVDKKSFIRAKQAQIHQERARRKHEIETLRYERIINDGLMQRIDRLLTALKSHRPGPPDEVDAVVFRALIESAGDPAADQPPPPPKGVHEHVKERPSFSKMMAALVDQVKQEVDNKDGQGENRFEAFISGVEAEQAKVTDGQRRLMLRLEELEKEEKKHITSDDIHTGFDVSHVAKKDEPAASKSQSPSVELLNPDGSQAAGASSAQTSGSEADIEDGGDLDKVKASKEALEFSKIKSTDYAALHDYLRAHPSILSPRDQDGLYFKAFEAQMDGDTAYAKQCVHHSILLQFCRTLGPNGASVFFNRIAQPGHQSRTVFLDDVNDTYAKVCAGAERLARQRADAAPEEREQIQLQAVDPNTTINISIPPPVPAGADGDADERAVSARRMFESFPPALRAALESGRLDRINAVLGKMSVSEGEDVVSKLSEGGMLSIEEGIVDATTEEGQRFVEEIEKAKRLPGDAVEEKMEGEDVEGAEGVGEKVVKLGEGVD